MKKLTEHQIEKAATEIINYLNKKSGWRGFIEGALWMQDLALPQAPVIKSLPADWEFLIKDLMLFVEKNGDVCNGFRSRETILEMKKKIEAGNVL